MASALLLTMLKTDLGIMQTTAYDTRLGQYLDAAEQEIIKEGVSDFDTSSIDDAQLVVMYAAWLWRKRDTMEGMPRMVRYALNNRVFKGDS
ncbi:MAG: hypothetical protein II483_00520 [Lachnospiraceae bacterium]|nr:hypothetical protein [Lachnospiraceae bacterium]